MAKAWNELCIRTATMARSFMRAASPWPFMVIALLCSWGNGQARAVKGLFKGSKPGPGVDVRIKVVPGGRIDDEGLFLFIKRTLITNDVSIDGVLAENLMPRDLRLIHDKQRRGVQVFLPGKNQNLLINTDTKGHPKLNKNGAFDIHFISNPDINEPDDLFFHARPRSKR